MTMQYTVLGEITPAISTEITAMKKLDFGRVKTMFHLKVLRETQDIQEMAEALSAYSQYDSSLACRTILRLKGSLTVQVVTIRLVPSYDPEKHCTIYETQLINRVGPETRLFDLDTLQSMVHLLNAQTQAPRTLSIMTPRFVLLLGDGKTFRGNKLVAKHKQMCEHAQQGMGNIELMSMEEACSYTQGSCSKEEGEDNQRDQYG